LDKQSDQSEALRRSVPLIEMRQATVWRGRTCVLKNFSLTIEQNEHVAILGPNGSGKTTLLKTISRELRPVAKHDTWVKILGRENWNVWALRKHIGLISHDLQAGFAANANVLEVVLSGFFCSVGLDDQHRAELQPEQLELARALVEQLGLQSLLQRKYHTLSTGQQRRCLLGRALVHDPHTLIFDEPTAGLDITASFDLLAQVSELVQRGRSLLWVTHHLNDIPREIERVIILKNGAIVADGPKSEVLTRELLSDVFETRLDLTEVDGHYLAFPARR
jgi:iron complex transport system ATP-binding protein